jgi:exopolyphosphatase/guanosine-5'-triphosphate,3'-diphosphate pyrophosphatase
MTEAFSKPLGAVRLTEMFLKSDPADPRELARMRRYIQERLMGPAGRFRGLKFDRMIATSATAAAAVCAVNRVRRPDREDADQMRSSAAKVRALYGELALRAHAKRARVTGIGPRRAEIIVAGIAVLREIMDTFKLPGMYYSTAGVRDGIVADLAHRKVGHEQARLDADQLRVVRDVGKRCGVDARHVRKVADLSAMLFHDLGPLHKLPQSRGKVLEAAAYLYNVGHFVNEAKHHRHSMYIVANSDMPGFEDRERLMIANLCRYHRKSLPQSQHEPYQMLALEDRRTVALLTPLLRLAVSLDQSQLQRVERIEVHFPGKAAELRLFSTQDVDIEQWQAGQNASVFQEVFGMPLSVRVRR